MLEHKSNSTPEGQKPKPNSSVLKPSYASQLKQDKPGQHEAIPRRAANGKMAVFMGRGKTIATLSSRKQPADQQTTNTSSNNETNQVKSTNELNQNKSGEDAIKVSDYQTLGTPAYSLSTNAVKGKSYYEGLVLTYFSVSFELENKNEQAAVYKEIWENCPKQNSIPGIKEEVTTLVAIKLNDNRTVYYQITYKENNFIDVNFLTSSEEGAYTTTESHTYAPVTHLEKIIFGERPDKEPKYADTFPPISEESSEKNRLSAFFRNPENKDARSAYLGFMEMVYYKNLSINKKIDKKISKLADGLEEASYDGELTELKEIRDRGYLYPFTGLAEGGGYTFLVKGKFIRANPASQIGLAELDVICLKGKNAGIKLSEESEQKQSFMDGKIEGYYLKNSNSPIRPNFIGLENIVNKDEQQVVQKFIFEQAIEQNFDNRFRDTHFDQIIEIDGDRIVYSFTISNPEIPPSTIEGLSSNIPEGKKQLNILIERQGKIGNASGELSDPDSLRINDVHGYSDQFSDEEFIQFVTSRYTLISASDIKGVSKIEKIDAVNSILQEKAITPDWYKNNTLYSITILNDLSTIKSTLVDDLDFYIEGEKTSQREQARVKGKTDTEPGVEAEDSETSLDYISIKDETEGIKPWNENELKYLEMSLQKLGTETLKSIQGVKYFRQDYNKLKGTYNKVAGLTFSGTKTVGLYDSGFSSSSRVTGGGTEFTSPIAWTITHETGHVIQNTNGNRELFNNFYKSIGSSGPTKYSRSHEISSPESEFFPEALTLFFHDPTFLYQNFPQIYMWFYFLNSKGKGPTKKESSAFILRRDLFINEFKKEPSLSEIHNLTTHG